MTKNSMRAWRLHQKHYLSHTVVQNLKQELINNNHDPQTQKELAEAREILEKHKDQFVFFMTH